MYGPDEFTEDAERLAAGGCDVQARARADERGDQRRARIQQVLAVVQHDQHVAVGDRSAQFVDRRPPRLVDDPHGVRHRGRDQIRVGDGSQVDIGDAVVEHIRHAGDRLDGEPCLADASGTHQRDDPLTHELRSERGYFGTASHEAGERSWHHQPVERRTHHATLPLVVAADRTRTETFDMPFRQEVQV